MLVLEEKEKVDGAQECRDQWWEGEMIMDQDVGLWGTKRLASCKKEHSEAVNGKGVDQCTMERIN